MAYPPPTLPTNRTNATAQQDTHPGDHNAVNLAMNDTVGRLNALIAQVTVIEGRTHDWTVVHGEVNVPAGSSGWISVNLGVPLPITAAISSQVWRRVNSPLGGVTWQNYPNHDLFLEGLSQMAIAFDIGSSPSGDTFRVGVFYNPVGTLVAFDVDELTP